MPDSNNDRYMYIGPGFRVREFRADDVGEWYGWFNDPSTTEFMLHGVIPNTIEAQERFRVQNCDGKRKICFALVSPDSPELIGTCSINIVEPLHTRRGEISLVLGSSKYRAGPIYLSITAWQLDHAFFNLNLNSVCAATHESNQAVQETLQRLGFNRCGVMRQTFYKHGQYWDSVWFDILQSEWMQKRSS